MKTNMCASRRMRDIGVRLVCGMTLAAAGLAEPAHAAIPASERQALVDLYTATVGTGWSNDEGWLDAAGSECTWYGITCDAAQAHVTEIRLDTNSLRGTLPSLVGLPRLQYFDVDSNNIGGTLPALASLQDLRFFHAEFNSFTGTLPALAGLVQLESFDAAYNELSGPLPSLAGLVALKYFYVYSNNLTGTLPSLASLESLIEFTVGFNELTGSVPPLSGLANLAYFDVRHNALSGTLPSLAGLSNLENFLVSDNELMGIVPDVPHPNEMYTGSSQLCPNHFESTPNADWDDATESTPWYADCTPLLDVIFAAGFEA